MYIFSNNIKIEDNSPEIEQNGTEDLWKLFMIEVFSTIGVNNNCLTCLWIVKFYALLWVYGSKTSLKTKRNMKNIIIKITKCTLEKVT